MIAAVAGGITKGNDLQASNVPGIREDVYLAGARVERMYPYAPRPGCAAMITMLTHGDTCCVGANLDPAAITDRDLFGGASWRGSPRCSRSGETTPRRRRCGAEALVSGGASLTSDVRTAPR